jgi:hypothetical protein
MPMPRNRFLIRTALSVFLVSGWAQAMPVEQPNAAAQSEPGRSITVPGDTSVIGRLQTNLDAAQAKVGDAVEVQTMEDIKSGHDVLVKKGSTVNGHVTSVQQASGKNSQCVVAILFDRVTVKNGEQVGLNLGIQAIASQMDIKSDTLMDGRGMAQSGNNAAVAGHTDAMTGSIDGLSHKSAGTYGMPGVTLANQTDNGKHVSLVVSTSGNVRLKKGMQIVMESVSQ